MQGTFNGIFTGYPASCPLPIQGHSLPVQEHQRPVFQYRSRGDPELFHPMREKDIVV